MTLREDIPGDMFRTKKKDRQAVQHYPVNGTCSGKATYMVAQAKATVWEQPRIVDHNEVRHFLHRRERKQATMDSLNFNAQRCLLLGHHGGSSS